MNRSNQVIRLLRGSRWLGVLAAVALLASCSSVGAAPDLGDGSTTTSTIATSGSGEPVLDFYQCLRDGGLDVTDPDPNGPIALQGVDGNDPATVAVIRHCADTHLAGTNTQVGVGGQMGSNMARPEALLAFVDCMRDNGVDMADPDSDGRLSIPEGADPQGQVFQSAVQSCADRLEGGGIIIGAPGGGGTVTRRGN
jgi:hypothetical protein